MHILNDKAHAFTSFVIHVNKCLILSFVFFEMRFRLFEFCCCHSYHQDEIKFTRQVNFCNIYFGLILTVSMKRTEILEL
jgi:hypothetical protein